MKQFQSAAWPEEGVPDCSSVMIDLIGQVQKWQMSSGNKPIIVHCRYVDRASCTMIQNTRYLSSVLTCMKSNKTVSLIAKQESSL